MLRVRLRLTRSPALSSTLRLRVVSSAERLRPEGRKIEGQPANLKASLLQSGVDVQRYLQTGFRLML